MNAVDVVTGSAGQGDLEQTKRNPVGAVLVRLGRAEEGHDWAADGRREVHRAGVVAEKKVGTRQDGGRLLERELAHEVEHGEGHAAAERLDQRTVLWASHHDDRPLAAEASSYPGEVLDRQALAREPGPKVESEKWPARQRREGPGSGLVVLLREDELGGARRWVSTGSGGNR